jgi:hypothetical protein
MEDSAKIRERKHRRARAFKAVRWIHLHLSLFSFLLLLVFAVTGYTLHHAQAYDVRTTEERTIEAALAPEQLAAPDRNAVAAVLAEKLHPQGELTGFDAQEDIIQVVYSAPGHRTEVQIDRQSGDASVSFERGGLIEILDDIHSGKNARRAGGWLIDLSAILLALVALSGVALTWFLHARNHAVWISLAAGCVLSAGLIAAMAFL